MLGVSRSWVYQAADEKRIPHVRLPGFGGREGPLRFDPEEIAKWMNEHRKP